MSSEKTESPDCIPSAVFLVWGPPAYSNRSRLLADALGVDVRHVYSTRRRGFVAAFVKYPYQAITTLVFLIRRRPDLVIVQHPPGFAVMFIGVWAAVARSHYVVDAHSDAFDSRYWRRPEVIYRLLARRAVATIVTNLHSAEVIRSWGGRAIVVRDIPTRFDPGPYELGEEFNVAVVATFAPDEPIEEIVEAARRLPDVEFRITGDPDRVGASIPTSLPGNVELTGFLPLESYYGLLAHSDVVMVLTTRNHTMQRGACEALSLGTPIITSRWPLLQDYFAKGTIHVDNTAEGIGRGVEEMRANIDVQRRHIVELREEVDVEWAEARARLVEQLQTVSERRPSARVKARGKP